MLSTMYFLSGEEKLLKLMPAAFVTSTKATGWRLEVVLICCDASGIDGTQRHVASAHNSWCLRLTNLSAKANGRNEQTLRFWVLDSYLISTSITFIGVLPMLTAS
jgi:hypothetical protein